MVALSYVESVKWPGTVVGGEKRGDPETGAEKCLGPASKRRPALRSKRSMSGSDSKTNKRIATQNTRRRAIARAVLSTDALAPGQRRHVDSATDSAELATLPYPTAEAAYAARQSSGVVRIGEDGDGAIHILDTRHGGAEVRAHEGGDVVQRYDLLETDRTLDDWIQYVAHARGWAHLAAGLTIPAEGDR